MCYWPLAELKKLVNSQIFRGQTRGFGISPHPAIVHTRFKNLKFHETEAKSEAEMKGLTQVTQLLAQTSDKYIIT